MKKDNLYIFFMLFSLTGYAWLLWHAIDSTNSSAAVTVCAFKEVTHLPCPSCGTTRSIVFLLRGHLWESFMLNPFGAVLMLALVVIPLWIISDTLRRCDSFFRGYISAERFINNHTWVSVPVTAAVLLNWIWNIVKGI